MAEEIVVDTKPQGQEGLLMTEEEYIANGVHIGTKFKSADMKEFIFKVRNDGLYILDIKKTDERIRIAGKFLSRFNAEKVVVVSARQFAQKPAKIFAEKCGFGHFIGRFIPGTMTNPILPKFSEPELLFLTDPAVDGQAQKEAINIGIPIVGICDVNNETKYVDLVIPSNNKGRRALATIYWLLTREVLKAQGKIAKNEEFEMKIDDFEAEL